MSLRRHQWSTPTTVYFSVTCPGPGRGTLVGPGGSCPSRTVDVIGGCGNSGDRVSRVGVEGRGERRGVPGCEERTGIVRDLFRYLLPRHRVEGPPASSRRPGSGRDFGDTLVSR